MVDVDAVEEGREEGALVRVEERGGGEVGGRGGSGEGGGVVGPWRGVEGGVVVGGRREGGVGRGGEGV